MSELKVPPIGQTRATVIDNAAIRYFEKRVGKISQLPTLQPGEEINFPVANEVALYSDRPVDLQVGVGGRVFTAITDVRLQGNINKLFIRQISIATPGAYSIYIGQPTLGQNFSREAPLLKQPYRLNSFSELWTAAATQYTTVGGLFISVSPKEAFYVTKIIAGRATGTITDLRYQETDTGGGNTLLQHSQAGNSLMVYEPPNPIKIANSGTFRLEGSSEVAATSLEIKVMGLAI